MAGTNGNGSTNSTMLSKIRDSMLGRSKVLDGLADRLCDVVLSPPQRIADPDQLQTWCQENGIRPGDDIRVQVLIQQRDFYLLCEQHWHSLDEMRKCSKSPRYGKGSDGNKLRLQFYKEISDAFKAMQKALQDLSLTVLSISRSDLMVHQEARNTVRTVAEIGLKEEELRQRKEAAAKRAGETIDVRALLEQRYGPGDS